MRSCFVLILAGWMSVAGAAERRVMFDEDFNWLTPADADRTLQRTADAGFNVFVPCVWHGRGTTWPSALAPREPQWEQQYASVVDPLAYLIRAAHARGIEVHPWFTVMLRQREFFPAYYDAGTPEFAFDVHTPEFRDWIVNLIGEVIERYDVDGINLDYIRSIGVCRSARCAQDYYQATARDLERDLNEQREGNGAWRAIGLWNASGVDRIVQAVRGRMDKVKPGLPLSVDSQAAMPWLQYQGTDAIAWANAGWIDTIYHMDYAPVLNTTLWRMAARRINDPARIVFLVGNYEQAPSNRGNVWPRAARRVTKLMTAARALNPRARAIALYEYRFLTPEQIDVLRPSPAALNK